MSTVSHAAIKGLIIGTHGMDGQLLQTASAFETQAFHTGTDAGVNPALVVSSRGTIFYSPAQRHHIRGVDVACSRDQGQTWQIINVPRAHELPPDYIPIRREGLSLRVLKKFSEATPDGGSSVAFTDDDGKTWQHAVTGEGSWDWGKLCFGPAATERGKQALRESGYPHVVYFSATGPILIYGPNQINYRSYDGGITWQRTADAFSPEFMGSPIENAGYPQGGCVDSKGSVYRTWAGRPIDYTPRGDLSKINVNILISRDEGESWEYSTIPDSHTTLLGSTIAVDRADCLYCTWADSRDGQIRLAVSRNGARTWLPARSIRIPGVAWANKPTITTKNPGEIAIAFWGSDQAESTTGGDGWRVPDGRPNNGYVTVCLDLVPSEPVFRTAMITTVEGKSFMPNGATFDSSGEFLGAPAFAPDGSVWAGFLNAVGMAPGGIALKVELK